MGDQKEEKADRKKIQLFTKSKWCNRYVYLVKIPFRYFYFISVPQAQCDPKFDVFYEHPLFLAVDMRNGGKSYWPLW